MLQKWLSKLIGSTKAPASQQHDAYDYQSYSVTPSPKPVTGGFSTEAIITKEIDGERKTHHFIRSDVTGSQDAAIEFIHIKVKHCIDQQGDRIFT